MGSYIPSTREERLSMLESIGMHSFDELYADIPEKLRFKDGLSLPSGLSELEVFRKMEEIAEKIPNLLIFSEEPDPIITIFRPL